MKKIIFLLLAISYTVGSYAQRDISTRRWFIGANYKFGMLDEKVYLRSLTLSYPSAANSYQSDVKVKNDNPTVFDVQLGYYFDRKCKWGIAAGLIYVHNTSTMTLDSMHVEYRSVDFNNDVFRQVISNTKPITENLDNTSMSVPLVLKYRTMISKHIGFTMDAGMVYNLKMESTYTSQASFDYEAIYKFQTTNGQTVAVYDNAKTAGPSDWFITKKEYNQDRGDGQEAAYFQQLHDQGYSVALNAETKAQTSSVAHKTGSIGLLLQPTFTLKLSNTLQLNAGIYYMHQRFLNTSEQEGILRTDKIGEYNSMLNAAHRKQDNYGLSLGISVHM